LEISQIQYFVALCAVPKCKVKQNARGGLFYVVNDAEVAKSLPAMMKDTEQ
jgi:hypothetical protein